MSRRAGRAICVGLTLVACGVAFVAAASAADAPTAPPPLAAVADTYDAGRVAIGVPVTHTYELHDTGSTALAITVKATCGCTTTDYDELVPAGGTGKVTAVLDTRHVRGRVAKTLHVTTDDPAQPPLTLTMIAETIRFLDVLPSATPVLRAPVGALKPLVLTVTAPDGKPFAIVRVEDDPDLRARVEAGTTPFTVVAAEPSDRDFTATAVAAEDGRAWDVTLRYARAADRHGPVNAVLAITTDEPTQPSILVRIAGEL